mmetsp:Transcript_6575/g.17648  ORF Transcript_6575/g.17648 Transcript_6575/m.17648 type:complete len:255 (-) Transcript_6575:54-818(-)
MSAAATTPSLCKLLSRGLSSAFIAVLCRARIVAGEYKLRASDDDTPLFMSVSVSPPSASPSRKKSIADVCCGCAKPALACCRPCICPEVSFLGGGGRGDGFFPLLCSKALWSREPDDRGVMLAIGARGETGGSASTPSRICKSRSALLQSKNWSELAPRGVSALGDKSPMASAPRGVSASAATSDSASSSSSTSRRGVTRERGGPANRLVARRSSNCRCSDDENVSTGVGRPPRVAAGRSASWLSRSPDGFRAT